MFAHKPQKGFANAFHAQPMATAGFLPLQMILKRLFFPGHAECFPRLATDA